MKILLVTNIPTPYRNSMFNEMHKIFIGEGLELEVWYMAATEPNRHWKLAEMEFNYVHRIFKDFSITIGNYFLHFNLNLVWKCCRYKYDVLIVGGAYSSPTHALLSIFAPRKSKKVLWLEGTRYSMQKTSFIIRLIKKTLMNRYSYFVSPGLKSEELIRDFIPSVVNSCLIRMPNLIDDKIYELGVAKKRQNITLKVNLCAKIGVQANSVLFFACSRPDYMKGLDVFIKSLAGILGVSFLVAGDGPLTTQLKKLAESLDVSVFFLGNKKQEELTELYAIADVFIIPSTWDSNPLAAIEGIAAGLPILASPYIGNFNEILIEGVNGWTFDPRASIPELNRLIKNVISQKKGVLEEMGKESVKLYRRNFNSRQNLTNFANKIRSISL